MKENLLVILGPTASGKTDLSIDVALKFNGEIISGDSMQVYRGMDIGTAKISAKEKKGVPHHLIDIHDPDYHFTVAEFQEKAREKIKEINDRDKLPIIVGGTGLYIKSVTHQYQFSNASHDITYRNELENYAASYGNEALHTRLTKVDPIVAQRLHINDTKRIVRALEIYHLTGKTMSEQLENQAKLTPYNLLMIGLTMDRKKLYHRINKRVDLMLEQGLIDEVKVLANQGYTLNHNAMQAIGYKEIIQYLNGELSLERAIELIKQGTRRFAKRQLSWFRQIPEIKWYDLTDEDSHQREKIKNNIYTTIAGNF